MKHPKFVQICGVDGFLNALDENGRVWQLVYLAGKTEWHLVTDVRKEQRSTQ